MSFTAPTPNPFFCPRASAANPFAAHTQFQQNGFGKHPAPTPLQDTGSGKRPAPTPLQDTGFGKQPVPGAALASDNALDPHQLAVVSSPQRSLLVRSCAGSGKSSTLAARAKALLASGIPASSLCLLTFSVRSKADLEAKLAEACGGALPLPVVSTYHAKALAVVRAAGCTLRIIEAGAQVKLARKVLQARPGGPPPKEVMREATRAAIAFVAKVKSSGRRPPEHSKEAQLLDAYNSALRDAQLVDFDDLILLATDALRTAAMEGSEASLAPGLRRPAHCLVDEAQDTSDAQLLFLEALAPPGEVCLTAVGDPDQSIYAFRGVRHDALHRIGQQWECAVLNLPTNYRSGERIVSAAKHLIEASPLRNPHAPPLLSAPALQGAGIVECHMSHRPSDELLRLATELHELQSSRAPTTMTMASSCALHSTEHAWPPGGVAILCRTRAQVREVASTLKEAGIRIACRSRGSGGGDESSGTGDDSLKHKLRGSSLELAGSLVGLVARPEGSDAAVEAMIQLPLGTGGHGASRGAGKAVGYLHTVQCMLSTSGGPSGASGQYPAPSSGHLPSLLAAAQWAASRSFPNLKGSVSSRAVSQAEALFPGQAPAVTLPPSQQVAMRAVVNVVAEAKERAQRLSPSQLLEWLVQRVGLGDHLENERKAADNQKRAFTVRVPGMGSAHGASSDDDADDDDDDDAPWDSGRASSSATGGSQDSRRSYHGSPPVAKALTWLLSTARRVESEWHLESAAPSAAPRVPLAPFSRGYSRPTGDDSEAARERLSALGRFADALLLASHEESAPSSADPQAALVTTFHQAKGLEWDDVYLPLLTEGSLPLRPRASCPPNSNEELDHFEEERRLAYVGFTRARRRLVLSCSGSQQGPPTASDSVPPAARGGAASATHPSRFLAGLRGDSA